MTTFHTLGFPRVGPQRELKWALESYWRGEIDQATLISRCLLYTSDAADE